MNAEGANAKLALAADLGLPAGWRATVVKCGGSQTRFKYWDPNGDIYTSSAQLEARLGDQVPEALRREVQTTSDSFFSKAALATDLGLPPGWRATVVKCGSSSTRHKYWDPEGNIYTSAAQLAARLGDHVPQALCRGPCASQNTEVPASAKMALAADLGLPLGWRAAMVKAGGSSMRYKYWDPEGHVYTSTAQLEARLQPLPEALLLHLARRRQRQAGAASGDGVSEWTAEEGSHGCEVGRAAGRPLEEVTKEALAAPPALRQAQGAKRLRTRESEVQVAETAEAAEARKANDASSAMVLRRRSPSPAPSSSSSSSSSSSATSRLETLSQSQPQQSQDPLPSATATKTLPAKSAWEQLWSEEYGIPYWWNPELDQSLWERPPDA